MYCIEGAVKLLVTPSHLVNICSIYKALHTTTNSRQTPCVNEPRHFNATPKVAFACFVKIQPGKSA